MVEWLHGGCWFALVTRASCSRNLTCQRCKVSSKAYSERTSTASTLVRLQSPTTCVGMDESDMKVKRIWHESVQKTETLGHASTVSGWTISLHSVARLRLSKRASAAAMWVLSSSCLALEEQSIKNSTGVEREKNKNSWAPCLIFPFAVQMQLGFEELLKIVVFLAERKPSQLGDLAMVMRHASTLVTSDSTKEKFKHV